MNRQNAKNIIKVLTIIWIVAGAGLAGAVAGGLITMDLFQWLFAGGFIFYAVVTTVLSRAMFQSKE